MLEHLLKCTNKVFDIVAVSETKIAKKISLTSNLNLQNYSFEFTPTESSAGGTLLYIAGMALYEDIFMKCLSLHSANIAQDHRWNWTYLYGEQIQGKKASSS